MQGLLLADVIGLADLFVAHVVDADVVLPFGDTAQGEASVGGRDGAEIQCADVDHGALNGTTIVVEDDAGDRPAGSRSEGGGRIGFGFADGSCRQQERRGCAQHRCEKDGKAMFLHTH